jgi:hypothetical protein
LRNRLRLNHRLRLNRRLRLIIRPNSDCTTTRGPRNQPGSGRFALVEEGGTSSANGPNFLGGGQAGCNWSGTLVYGFEGDVDSFCSNPQVINGTATPATVSRRLHSAREGYARMANWSRFGTALP